MSLWAVVVCGCVGGLLPDVLRLVNTRYESGPVAYLRSARFWVSLGLLVAVGGFAAWVLGATNPKEAVAYGFSAPELLSRLLAEPPARPEDVAAAGTESAHIPGAVGPPAVPVPEDRSVVRAVRAWWTR